MAESFQIALPVPTSNVTTSAQAFRLLVDSFIHSLDVSERSRKSYRANIEQFIRWLEDCNISNPSRETILEYKRHLHSRNLSTFTSNAYIVAVRLFFSWAESEKIYPNIARTIKGYKKPAGHQRDPLTKEQALGLLKSIDRTTINGLRDYAIINLLIRTAMRSIELVRSDINDIRPVNGKICLFIHGKGRQAKDEPVVLEYSCYKPILEYLTARGNPTETEPLFVSLSDRNMNERLTTYSVSRIVKRALRSYGINSSRITCHSMRHTCLSLFIEGGGNILDAQVLGRHSQVQTTMTYVHRKGRIERAPEALIESILNDEVV